MAAGVKAFVFGVTVAAAIGPIALLIVNVAAADGLARGLRAAIGVATADLVFALTAFGGGRAISTALEAYRPELVAGASAVLVVFGLRMVALLGL